MKHSRRHHYRHLGPYILLISGGGFLLGYALLEKKLLPRLLWRPLSIFYFYPMMIPNLLVRMARDSVTGRTYFSDVDGGVMLGATPMVIAGHVNALHRDGVRAVVNMQAEYQGPVAAYAALHPPIQQLRVPVTDHVEPSVEQLETSVAFIRQHRTRGHRVLIHCKGGHGRSAAVAMAWLISEGLTPDAAQRRLASVRHVRSKLYQQPDILEFYARHGQGQKRSGADKARRR